MRFNDLSVALRELIKVRKLTYKELATQLKMSESGVKKLLTAEDIAFNKLAGILDLLDIDMKDLLSFKRTAYPALTEVQEKFLFENIQHYNFFIQLHHFRNDLKLVKKENPKLSKFKMDTYIEDLKKIGLLVKKEDRLQSAIENGFVASKKLDGYFLKRAHRVMEKALIEPTRQKRTPWSFEGLGHFSLSRKSAMEYNQALKNLLEEFSTRSERERIILPSQELIQAGSLLLSVPMRMKDLFPL